MQPKKAALINDTVVGAILIPFIIMVAVAGWWIIIPMIGLAAFFIAPIYIVWRIYDAFRP